MLVFVAVCSLTLQLHPEKEKKKSYLHKLSTGMELLCPDSRLKMFHWMCVLSWKALILWAELLLKGPTLQSGKNMLFWFHPLCFCWTLMQNPSLVVWEQDPGWLQEASVTVQTYSQWQTVVCFRQELHEPKTLGWRKVNFLLAFFIFLLFDSIEGQAKWTSSHYLIFLLCVFTLYYVLL